MSRHLLVASILFAVTRLDTAYAIPNADGSGPGVVAVSDTTVFGAASSGGANGDGTIWSFDTSSDTFTKLHDFGVPEPSTVTLSAMCVLTLLAVFRTRAAHDKTMA